MVEHVFFETADGVRIAADVSMPKEGAATRAVLLLHMMPATKESWREFANALVDAGFMTLAIDLRGHGESRTDALDYTAFTDAQHQKYILDVEAAMRWISEKGIGLERTAIVGASIGANLAIVYAAAHTAVSAVGALSPGLDYRGVVTLDAASAISAHQGLFLAASDEDTYAMETIKRLSEKKPDAVVREFRGAGHGTAMLSRANGLSDELVAWLSSRVR